MREAEPVVVVRQLRFQFDRALKMLRGSRKFPLIKIELTQSIVSLPRVRILREVISPERFFILENRRSRPGITDHCAKQQDNRGAGYNAHGMVFRRPETRDARAEKRDQRDVGEILQMICDDRSAARVGHAHQTDNGSKGDDETGEGQEQSAYRNDCAKTRARPLRR